MQTDAELVKTVLNGESDTYEALVKRYERPVRAVVLGILRDYHSASDVSQDAFIKAFENLAGLRKPESFGPWLMKIARRCALNAARKKPENPLPDSQIAGLTENPGSRPDEDKQRLLAAVVRLPKTEKQVVMLRYFGQNSVKDVAEMLGRSTGTVTKQLSRAHKRLRLREIAAHYQKHPLPEIMELLPRESDEKFNAYAPGRLIDITNTTGHWVLPLQFSLGDFLRIYFYPRGSLRVPEEYINIQLNHDLVTKNEHTARDRINFVLDALGLELAEVNEPRTVWIAHYDGRPLKPWRQVKAPVPNPNHVPLRPGMASVWSPFSIKELFDSFAYWQDYDLTASGIIIIDETGLPSEPVKGQGPESVAVSSESPYWGGEESVEIAKKWFSEQFGITFTEEIRPMTVYQIGKQK